MDLTSDGEEEEEGDEGLAKRLQLQYDLEAKASAAARAGTVGGPSSGATPKPTPKPTGGGKAKAGGKAPAGQGGLMGWLGGAKATPQAGGGSTESTGQKRKSVLDGTAAGKAMAAKAARK